tara:strand:+ start:433 stop:795 length:363 start_codon:yes stop_codon:yes gene_type:complete
MKIKAIYNACVVKPIEAEETVYGNIIVPDMGKDTNTFGEVISVGPGNFSFSGVRIKTQLKVGDKVVLPTQGFTKLPFEGEEYFVGPENQVLAVIEESVDLEEVVASTEVSEEDLKNIIKH